MVLLLKNQNMFEHFVVFVIIEVSYYIGNFPNNSISDWEEKWTFLKSLKFDISLKSRLLVLLFIYSYLCLVIINENCSR